MNKAVLGILTATVLAAGAPAAHAHHVTGDCGYANGLLYGWFVHPGTIEVNCWMQLNGARVPNSDLDVDGALWAADSRTVSFVATDVDVVEVCVEIVQPAPGHTACSVVAP